MWRQGDEAWARARGLFLEDLEAQVTRLTGPRETIRIERPATMGDGIGWLDASGLDDIELPASRITTFIPASGAATRMFASVVRAHERGFGRADELEAAVARGEEDVRACLEAYHGRGRLAVGRGLEHAELGAVLHHWVVERNYPARPKGLVPFHRYAHEDRTAVVEHVLEAVELTGTVDTTVHFTVPSGMGAAFVEQRQRAAAVLGGEAPRVGWSVQHPSTDTIAVTLDGAPFRDEDGHPLMRPGGHGSLLRNLEALGADLVVIKNIDNVTHDGNRRQVVRWRRGLLGRLLELETEVHRLLRGVRDGDDPAPAIDFAVRVFGRRGAGDTAEEMAWDALHRPLRVVGVVRNQGQPGGGPFWVWEEDGTSTPQIVEAAQVDRDEPGQAALFAASTHFNPVDMALSMRDLDGRPFPLGPWVDDRAWIRTTKTYRGEPLLALERPGLWNGGMAGWNTCFVEIPAWVFNPVKELRDLLGPGHDPGHRGG